MGNHHPYQCVLLGFKHMPDEDDGDQSSITQTIRPEITQSQIEGLYFPNSL
jgi:hypothetical protein